MKEIARGAEAVLYQKKDCVIKHRLRKNYRLKQLDEELRKQRTRQEARLLQKITIPHPELIKTDGREKIVMQRIKGRKLRDELDQKPELARIIGEQVAELHNQHIIHGDLTTSNMILEKADKNKTSKKKKEPKQRIMFIDFGLSFHSQKIEDKAVDIHLFKQALNSKHHHIYEQALKSFLKGYAKAEQNEQVMKRLEKVEARGRYKKA